MVWLDEHCMFKKEEIKNKRSWFYRYICRLEKTIKKAKRNFKSLNSVLGNQNLNYKIRGWC